MNGSSSISKLIQQVLDLICKILVFPPDHIQLLHTLLVGSLDTIHFGTVVTTLRPASLQLSHHVVSLGLPLSEHLIKVSCSLLSDDSSSMSSLIFQLDVFQLALNTMFGLLSSGDLSIK